jgi:hypothetical protein
MSKMKEGRTGRRGDIGREGPPGREGVEGHEGPEGRQGPRGYGAKRHRIIAAYAFLVIAIIISFWGVQRYQNQKLQKEIKNRTVATETLALRTCRNLKKVAMNQTLVIETLLLDRTDKPGYLLRNEPALRRRSVHDLLVALKKVPSYSCGGTGIK